MGIVSTDLFIPWARGSRIVGWGGVGPSSLARSTGAALDFSPDVVPSGVSRNWLSWVGTPLAKSRGRGGTIGGGGVRRFCELE